VTQPFGVALRGWRERLSVSAFLAFYVIGLWGQAGLLLPAPFDDWHDVAYRSLAPWWHAHVLPVLTHDEQVALFQAVQAYLLAVLVPLSALHLLGISAVAAGLGRTRIFGLMATATGVALTLPVGFWLATVTLDPWGSPLQELLEFLVIPPEHFLIFGVSGVLLLPERDLAWPEAIGGRAAGVFTILALAIVFGLVHVGTPHQAELAASFLLGLLFAAMTVLTGSIWPAVIAHVMLNLVPMAVLSSG
jgi:membrane protease YdiL (CAAX protease family)